MKKHYRFKLRIDRVGQDKANPVIMVVTKNRKRQFISIKGASALPGYWDKKSERLMLFLSPSTKDEKSENKRRAAINTMLEDYSKRAESIELEYLRENNTFWTLNQFKDRFNSDSTQGQIEPFLKAHIQNLKETHHHSNAINFNKLYNKLTLFDPEFINRRFSEIDYSYVDRFNLWMEKMSTSNNTRAFYLKRISVIYNKAIKSGEASQEKYPFGWAGFCISSLKTETNKRYMPTEYVNKLKTNKSTKPQREYARHVFLLSYYLYGMSFKDMAVLTKSNVVEHNDGAYIVYKRLKTQERHSKPISIKITESIKNLMDNLFTYRTPVGDYLLPIISRQKDSPTALAKHTQTLLIQYNKYLAELAEEFNIKMKLTSYVSRHTMAMQLQENQVPEHIISQMLGHKKLETTKIYLDSLDTSVIDKAVEVL